MARTKVSVHSPRIVQKSRTGVRIFWLFLWLAVIAGAAAYAYYLGQHGGGFFSHPSGGVEPDQSRTVSALQKENDGLHRRVAVLERSAQIDEEASRSVRDRLDLLEKENQGLREDVAFYRSIVSPEGGRSGMQIQNLKLMAIADSPGDYRYRIVLTQPLKRQSFVRGDVWLEVSGLRGGKSESLGLDQLARDGPARHHFKFKYFQELEGILKLPDDFKPLEVKVVAEISGKKAKVLRRRFDWPQ